METIVFHYIGEIKIRRKGYTLLLSGDLKTLEINNKIYKRINNRKYDNLNFTHDIMEYMNETKIKPGYPKINMKFPLKFLEIKGKNSFYENFLSKMIDIYENGGIYKHKDLQIVYPLDYYAKGKNIIILDNGYVSELFIAAKKGSPYIKSIIDKIQYIINNL